MKMKEKSVEQGLIAKEMTVAPDSDKGAEAPFKDGGGRLN